MTRTNANRLFERLREKLDRPGRRWLLIAPGSIWVSGQYRAPCVVYWRDGTWTHHYVGTRIPHAILGRAAPPDVLTAEAREIFLYDYIPRPGDIVFDIGAGIGAETLLFSRLVGSAGRVVSLEAHPRTYERMRQLVKANRLTNVTPLQVAATDVDGEALLSDSGHHLKNRLGSEGVRVPTRRIDSLATELGIGRIDFLKMNIEGAERSAIQGLDGIIGNVRRVCISCHDFLGDPEVRTKDEVRAFLVSHGFSVKTRDDAPEPWTRDYLYGARRLPTEKPTHEAG